MSCGWVLFTKRRLVKLEKHTSVKAPTLWPAMHVFIALVLVYIAVYFCIRILSVEAVDSFIQSYYPLSASCGVESKTIQLSISIYLLICSILSLFGVLLVLAKDRAMTSMFLFSILVFVFTLWISWGALTLTRLPPSLFDGQVLCFDLREATRVLTFLLCVVLQTYSLSSVIALLSNRFRAKLRKK